MLGKRGTPSRSTWACELKWYSYNMSHMFHIVTLHVSVWVEIDIKQAVYMQMSRHAPRERVSWNNIVLFLRYGSAVTLHVSVWVEIYLIRRKSFSALVTLHVSVWVEILWRGWSGARGLRVTLHVSVWVEIIVGNISRESRQVTLHVSVWVEILQWCYTAFRSAVTLHVSVWVEIGYQVQNCNRRTSHAPRERVSWNFHIDATSPARVVTLHVSVWVEIAWLLTE